MSLIPAIATTITLAATTAQALTPPLPCQVSEAGMRVSAITPLAEGSGVVVEQYANDVVVVDGVYRNRPGPVAVLNDFNGIRVTHCASGEFLAIGNPIGRPEAVAAALGATEFLRSRVQAQQSVPTGALKRAVRAVYGAAVTLRETDETCGCSWAYPELRPAGMTPFNERKDATP